MAIIKTKATPITTNWSTLRLKDRIAPGVRVLFVGINPGVRSALTGHHFAGYSNRFWKLLWEARLVPEPIGFEDDDRLPEFGFGITNLIARPSPGIDDLEPAEYIAGWRVVDRKIHTYRPEVVALVGVTLYRAIAPLIGGARDADAVVSAFRRTSSVRLKPDTTGSIRLKLGAARAPGNRGGAARSAIGPQSIVVHGARLFVLPNPSGRNANFTYAEMLAAFRQLRRTIG